MADHFNTLDIPSGGTAVTAVSAYKTSGDTTFPNTAGVWQAVSGFELAIAAAAGDYVELSVSALRTATANAYTDVAVIVGSSLAWYASSNTGTPAIEGEPGWYNDPAFITRPGPVFLTVGAGHLDSGQVRFVVAAKAGGTGTLYSSTNYPFRWCAKNYGAL